MILGHTGGRIVQNEKVADLFSRVGDVALEVICPDNALTVFQETYPDFHEQFISILQGECRRILLGDASKGDIVLCIVPEKKGIGFNLWFDRGGIGTRLSQWFRSAHLTGVEYQKILDGYRKQEDSFFSYEHPFSLPAELGARQIVDAILPHFTLVWNLRADTCQRLFREGWNIIQERKEVMDTIDYKMLSFEEVRAQYKAYLVTLGFSNNTISTAYTDTFYLWRKADKETFWQVLESGSFEHDAKEALINVLQANSTGNVDSLLGGYMAHLRRFRRFLGWELETTSIHSWGLSGQHRNRTVDVPNPSSEQVTYYLNRWSTLENYRLQERALNRLFHQLCPENKTIEDILLKAATLNDFYSTNIFAIFPVAKRILELNIDERLKKGDLTLVDELQNVVIGGKERHFYSFASKYCSHHNERDYPIYDRYVDEVLRYFRAKDAFAQFANDELKEYSRFKDILIAFRSYYGLGQFSLKEIDMYIWQLGKDYFSKFPES